MRACDNVLRAAVHARTIRPSTPFPLKPTNHTYTSVDDCTLNGVRSYPTFVYVDKQRDMQVEFTDRRSVAGFSGFLDIMAAPVFTPITTPAHLNQLLAANEVTLVYGVDDVAADPNAKRAYEAACYKLKLTVKCHVANVVDLVSSDSDDLVQSNTLTFFKVCVH